jgi:hypothetical protein
MATGEVVAFSGEKRERGWVAEIILEALAVERAKDPENFTPAEISLLTDKIEAAYNSWLDDTGTPNTGKALVERLGLEIQILRGLV